MGDPIELTVRGYELTLRIEDARRIEIQPLEEGLTLSAPGKGPERRCKSMSIIALMGNQNCGKTTLFNQLTGSKQHVGNFPGVTVDKKEGVVRKHENISVVDLPGIYSLSPYTSEEIVSRNFLLEEKPDAIINIIDATNIERNLYLTLQLMELRIPMVVAINMMDELRENGDSIDVLTMEKELGVPVVPNLRQQKRGREELGTTLSRMRTTTSSPSCLDF